VLSLICMLNLGHRYMKEILLYLVDKLQASPPHIWDPPFTFTNHILINFQYLMCILFLLFASSFFFWKLDYAFYFLNTFKKLGDIFIPSPSFFFNWKKSRILFTLWLANNLLNITFWFKWETNLIFLHGHKFIWVW